MSAIDAVLEKYVAAENAAVGGLKGVAFGVADKNGKVLYKKAFGGRSYDNDEKMTTNTVCWIASMTKFMTATSAAICVQKGLIKVDTDAGTVCKELDNINIVTGYDEDGSPKYTTAKEKVTLRSLCTHSSGLAYELFDPEMQKWAQATKRTVSTVDSTLECITIPLLFEPDSGWRYSVGLDWAGQIVERLTGKDLNTFMKENIWGPLGMKDTTFELYKNPELYKRQMQIGARELPTQPLVKGKGFHPDPAPIAMGGGGSYSTVDDYLKFITAVLQIKTGTVTDGFITKETADLLFTPQLKGGALASMQYQFALPDFHPGIAPAWPIDIKESNYALGGGINLEDIPGRRKSGTLMWSGMANTHWWIDPETGICATLMTQVLPPGDLTVVTLLNEVEEAVYKAFA